MKQLNTPFKLGMQYEDLEFDLEVIQDRLKGLDSYIYIGKRFNKFLDYPIHKTELLFRWEILEAVIITCKDKNSQFCKNTNLIIARTGELKNNLEEFAIFNVQISYIYTKKNVYIIYARNSLIKELVNSIR